jgi:hypothetical protein
MRALVITALGLGAVTLAVVLLAQRPRGSVGESDLPNSENVFTVPDHVGQPAPAFSAVGVDGKPYTVTPGDGRPKVLVFYMGYL